MFNYARGVRVCSRGNNTHYLPARQLITTLVSNSRFASIGSPIVVTTNRKNKI